MFRHLRLIAIALAVVFTLTISGRTALADSGSYTTASGESCSWFGSGSLYSISCGGYNRQVGGYVSYSCDLSVFGSSSSWSCRDSHGNSWRGSR